MGAFGMSSDSRDNNSLYYTGKEWKPIPNTSTPDPTNFEVIKRVVVNGYPIYWVKYPGVKNYEGNKILMYPKFFNEDLIKEKMDPHFFDKGDSPIARFEPTKYGFKLAIKLAHNL
jgi:hypothetical protein